LHAAAQECELHPKAKAGGCFELFFLKSTILFWGGAHRYTHDAANQELSVATKQFQPKK
jgi:hypothetical protein